MAAKYSSPFLRELARRLKAIRQERHLTLQEVYNATGIHVSRIESSGLNVTLLTLAKLCQYYQVQLTSIVEGLESLLEESSVS